MAAVPRMPVDADLEDDVVLLVPEVETVPEDALHEELVDQLAAGLKARFADRDDADRATQQADRLAEQLRQLGHDPGD